MWKYSSSYCTFACTYLDNHYHDAAMLTNILKMETIKHPYWCNILAVFMCVWDPYQYVQYKQIKKGFFHNIVWLFTFVVGVVCQQLFHLITPFASYKLCRGWVVTENHSSHELYLLIEQASDKHQKILQRIVKNQKYKNKTI